MHIWYGIKGTVDKKLSANLEELKAKGYPFTCKIFEDMGHGGLIGENTGRFIEEVDAVHLRSKKKLGCTGAAGNRRVYEPAQ